MSPVSERDSEQILRLYRVSFLVRRRSVGFCQRIQSHDRYKQIHLAPESVSEAKLERLSFAKLKPVLDLQEISCD